MAYMGQEKKKAIAAALKQAIPAGWKYSLAVRHHSTLVLTIYAAPVDLLADVQWSEGVEPRGYLQVNTYHWREGTFNADLVAVFEPIMAALNDGNFDKSDPMSDYFHVGWYVEVNIGTWQKPFVCTAPAEDTERPAGAIEVPADSELVRRRFRMPNGSHFVILHDAGAEAWEAYCAEIRARHAGKARQAVAA